MFDRLVQPALCTVEEFCFYQPLLGRREFVPKGGPGRLDDGEVSAWVRSGLLDT
jgi:hypothetical protein